MAKDKKKAKAAEAGEEAEKKSGGVIGKVVLLAALGVSSFGTVFMLPGNNQPSTDHIAESDVHEEEPVLDLTVETGYLTLSPLTVSLQDNAKILKIGITLETLAGEEDYMDPANPKIRDAFMGYLRALRLEQIEDAAFMAQMRAQLLRRAQLVLGKENVRGILITDFLVR